MTATLMCLMTLVPNHVPKCCFIYKCQEVRNTLPVYLFPVTGRRSFGCSIPEDGKRKANGYLHTRQVETVLRRPQARVCYCMGHYSITIVGTSLGKYSIVPQAEMKETDRRRQKDRKIIPIENSSPSCPVSSPVYVSIRHHII